VKQAMATRIQLTASIGDQVVLISVVSRPVWRIGRLPDNDLVLPAPDVSQNHAEIRLEVQGTVITDVGSINGTVVDGIRLLPNQPCLLKDGAAIGIGPYALVYRSLVVEEVDAGDVLESPASLQTKMDDLWRHRLLTTDNDQYGPFTDANQKSSYLEYLPVIFHDSDFLNRFLQMFEAIWEPLEQRQDHFEMYFNPRTCPASFLPWFASWFDLQVSPQLPEARLRSLLAEAIEIYRWRGTKYGLARMIEVCTGLKPEITETPSEPFVFRIKIYLSEGNSAGIDEIEKLIHEHKPAHAGYLLEVQ
jgi:phage tail-like protein